MGWESEDRGYEVAFQQSAYSSFVDPSEMFLVDILFILFNFDILEVQSNNELSAMVVNLLTLLGGEGGERGKGE